MSLWLHGFSDPTVAISTLRKQRHYRALSVNPASTFSTTLTHIPKNFIRIAVYFGSERDIFLLKTRVKSQGKNKAVLFTVQQEVAQKAQKTMESFGTQKICHLCLGFMFQF